MKHILFFFCFIAIMAAACKSEPEHPIHGKWKLFYVNDEDVSTNPDEILMEFKEDGTIINTADGQKSTGKFLISDDTTQISVMEGGKVITEYKIYQLNQEELVLEEGYDFVTFRKIDQ